jgi:hypothetical protein
VPEAMANPQGGKAAVVASQIAIPPHPLRIGKAIMARGTFPVGGRLSQFMPQWLKLTSDRRVLDIISKGYVIPFTTWPQCTLVPLETMAPKDPTQVTLLREEIESLVAKEAVEIVDPQSLGFYSHYFLASKKDGGWRPILNLKGLNKHVQCDKFRMETLQTILQQLSPGDWMYSMDLKDAYLHVPIFPAHRKYLRFAFRNPQGDLIAYQWKVLPFGLATSPRVFTIVVAPVIASLHVEGHRVSPYIDDMHGVDNLQPQAELSKTACLNRFVDLGFIVNLLKSHLVPTQDLIHLGGRIMTNEGVIRLPEAKATKIVLASQHLLTVPYVTARRFLSVTGLMTACLLLIPHCMLRVRPLTMHLMDHYTPGVDSLDLRIPLEDPKFREALTFWTSPANLLTGMPLAHPLDHLMVSTDASLTGWGHFGAGCSHS